MNSHGVGRRALIPRLAHGWHGWHGWHEAGMRLAGVVVGLAWGWHEAGTKGWFDVFIKCQLGVIYIMSVRGYL